MSEENGLAEKDRVKKARDRAMARLRRERLKAAGLCVNCLGPSRPGRVYCAACAQKYQEQRRARYEACRRARVCVSCCRADALPDSVLCEACRRKARGRGVFYAVRKAQERRARKAQMEARA